MRIRTLFFSAVALGAVVFIGIQFIRPTLTHPPVTADLQAPPEVKAIFVTSCYDCHSNEGKLKWFDYIQPGYWLVVRDIDRARMHLNFSEIGAKTPAQQQSALFEAVNQINLGEMPLKQYTTLHPDAVVTPEELATLKAYVKTFTFNTPTSPEKVAAADAQYTQWMQANAPAPQVTPEPNGFEFPAGYKDWHQLSSTVRDDNHTLRQVLGNDIAIKAVKDGQINPWPDGTIFAKVAWDQSVDANGTITAGAFKQVEFMEKNSQKYAKTEGWGWGRWLGPELKPYGTSPALSTSCTSCHAPQAASDFVFTMPIRTQPQGAQ